MSTITLTTAQISAVAAAATTAVQNAGMTDSADLIELLPKIIEGAQGSLSDMGLSSSETIKVIQVVVFSMTKSLSGRDAYLPSGSSASGSSPLETALSKVAETSISQLDEAGLGTSDIATASSALVGTLVGSLDDGGLQVSELSGAVEKITSGATGALGNVSGITVDDLAGVVEGITSGATGALDDISISGYDSSKLSTLVEKVTSGATSALGNIEMTGYSSDNLT
ncbi:MAG: hypothetical protein ABGX49_02955, partial [Candidatus Poseidoniia archaeon]